MIKLSKKQKDEILYQLLEGKVFDQCPICRILCKTEKAFRIHIAKHNQARVALIYIERHINLMRIFKSDVI